MHINELTNWLQHNGWKRDNYGNWIGTREFVAEGTTEIVIQEVRIKPQATSIRYERSWKGTPSTYNPKPPKEWLNIASDYLKYVHIEEVNTKSGGVFQALKIKNTRIPSVQLAAHLRAVWTKRLEQATQPA